MQPLSAAAFDWNLHPGLLALFVLGAVAYVRGCRRLESAGTASAAGRRLSAAAFAAGWGVLAVALLSPLESAGAWLLSAHVAQHALIVIVAAPLLVLGQPLAAWSQALGPAVGRIMRGGGRWPRGWRFVRSPLGACMLHGAALWGWYLPPWFELAQASAVAHAAQHVSLLGTALLFWASVFTLDMGDRAGPGWAFLSLFTTMLHTGVLGALLVFAAQPWYAGYLPMASMLGVDPLRDQQLGGVVMGVPATVAYVLAALGVLGRPAGPGPAGPGER